MNGSPTAPGGDRPLAKRVGQVQRIPEVGELLDGKFQLQVHAAGGGRGIVYRAWQKDVNRPVAIKFLVDGLGDDPRSEAQRAGAAHSRLGPKSAYVCSIYDVSDGVTSNCPPYIAMEWLDGEDLESERKKGAMKGERAARLILGAARAVDAVRSVRIFHLDLKPANLFVCRASGGSDEHIRLIDFGVAMCPDGPDISRAYRPGKTKPYVAPELLSEAATEDLARDERVAVYVLGVILHELLTGNRLHEGDSDIGIRESVLGRAVPDVPDASPELNQVIQLATAKHPDARHQTLEDLCADLEAAVKIEPSQVRRSEAPATAPMTDDVNDAVADSISGREIAVERRSVGEGGPVDKDKGQERPRIRDMKVFKTAVFAAVVILAVAAAARPWRHSSPTHAAVAATANSAPAATTTPTAPGIVSPPTLPGLPPTETPSPAGPSERRAPPTPRTRHARQLAAAVVDPPRRGADLSIAQEGGVSSPRLCRTKPTAMGVAACLRTWREAHCLSPDTSRQATICSDLRQATEQALQVETDGPRERALRQRMLELAAEIVALDIP